MIIGHIPKHRVLITKDTNTPEAAGGIILPLALRPVSTGTVMQSGVADIAVGDHVAWDSTLPSLPEIEIDGRFYLSVHKNNIKLIKHQTLRK